MKNLQKQRRGLDRLSHALGYSIQGLGATFRNEAAFRQEVGMLLVSLPLAALLAENPSEFLILVSAVLLVLLVELLNSAVESVVDRFGQEHHELAGRAKDQGSAAVLISLVIAAFVWIAVILN